VNLRGPSYLFLVLLSLSPFASAAEDTRDVVKLKAGGELRGRVVLENDAKLVLRASSREQSITKADVASVSSVARSMEEWLEKHAKLQDADVAGHLDLAEFCRARHLDREAKLEAYFVLRTEPDDEKAHQILEHRRGGKTWFARIDGGEVPWRLLDASTAEWGKALVVETEHYSVRSNAGCVAAVDLALDLETFYRTFFDVFLGELELREILEPMTVYAYRSREEFPGAGGHNGELRKSGEQSHPNRPWAPRANDPYGLLNPYGRIAHLYYDEVPGRPARAIHEAVHLLLYSMFQRERSGIVPPWIEEGMGQFFETAITGRPGRPVFALDVSDRKRFALLAGAEKVAHLTRIINAPSSDYVDASHRLRKSAEAYALVHFLMNGEYRANFVAYLKEAFKSNSSAGVFEKALGKRLEAVEKEWRNYIAEKAK
jgi:hypothetical protein